MAEGGGPNMEARLIRRLADIFADYDAELIRGAVYDAMVQMNGASVSEEALLHRCIDGLLMPPAQKRPLANSSPDAEEAKRSRRSEGTGGNSSMGSTSSFCSGLADESNIGRDDSHSESFDNEGAALPANDAEVERRMRQQNNLDGIIEMFPWIHPPWVVEQLEKPGFDMVQLVEQILTNEKTIPKKEKPKPQSAPCAPSSAGGRNMQTKSSQPAVAKDYLNDYVVPRDAFADQATHYLCSQFPQLRMDGVRAILRYYNYHLPPAFNVLHSAMKDVNTKKAISIPVRIVRPGKPDAVVTVGFLKTRRSVARRSLPPELQDEVAWIGQRFFGQGDGVAQAAAAASVNAGPSDVIASGDAGSSTASKEEVKLERARERGDVYECGICCDEFIISEQMIACADGHLFCVNCLRDYVRQAIYGQTKVDLSCMNRDCEGRFLRDMVTKALDPEDVMKFDEKLTFQALNMANMEGFEKCKYCDYACVFEVPPHVNKVFKCGKPGCEREYCRICFVDWEEHMGKPCKEVETEDDTRKRREAEDQMAAAVIRLCNRCKLPLIKGEGCNKLICSCGAMMCYLCRQSIKGYDHFCQHVRDPGRPGCQQCNNCSLWEDSKAKDSAAVKEIQSEARKALAELGKELKVGVDESPGRVNQQASNAARQRPVIVNAMGPDRQAAHRMLDRVVEHVAHNIQRVHVFLAQAQRPQNPILPNAAIQNQGVAPPPGPVRQLPQQQIPPPVAYARHQHGAVAVAPNGPQNPPVANAVPNPAGPFAPYQAAQGNPGPAQRPPPQNDPVFAPHGGARPRVYNAPAPYQAAQGNPVQGQRPPPQNDPMFAPHGGARPKVYNSPPPYRGNPIARQRPPLQYDPRFPPYGDVRPQAGYDAPLLGTPPPAQGPNRNGQQRMPNAVQAPQPMQGGGQYAFPHVNVRRGPLFPQ